MSVDREKWNLRYQQTQMDAPPQPARVLSDFAHLLPDSGQALDLACGRGGNALFLAQRGLQVEAWDISEQALFGLQAIVGDLPLTASVRDVIAAPPAPATFDVIVVSHFLHRPLFGALSAALRPGGLLYYQTFTDERVAGAAGPRNPDYLLRSNELLRAFCELRVLDWREEGLVGDVSRGVRNIAMLVAMRAHTSRQVK